MLDGEACPLDRNILLRIGKKDDPQHAAIGRALHKLVEQGVRLCYTSQTLAELPRSQSERIVGRVIWRLPYSPTAIASARSSVTLRLSSISAEEGPASTS
jgi:hypothetical protein